MFFKIGVLKNFAIFTGKPYSFLFKKRLNHKFFHVNIPEVLRTAFL